MRNKTKTIILLFCAFILCACVSTDIKRELVGSDFISNHPSLKIHFKKKVVNFKAQDLNYSFIFHGQDIVKLVLHKPDLHNVDYFYSLEFWIKSLGDVVYMGPSYFNDHEWARYALIKDSYLIIGYYTRKSYDFIEIFTFIKINDKLKSSFKDYQKALILNEDIKDLIDKRFEDLDALVEILY